MDDDTAMKTRKAKGGDAPSVGKLAKELGYDIDEVRVAEVINLKRDAAVFVAEVDRTIVGWIHVCLQRFVQERPFAEVTGLVVAESQRARGVGGQLLARAEEWAKDNGASLVRVHSNRLREQTPDFYSKHGYTLTKVQNVFEKAIVGDGGPPCTSAVINEVDQYRELCADSRHIDSRLWMIPGAAFGLSLLGLKHMLEQTTGWAAGLTGGTVFVLFIGFSMQFVRYTAYLYANGKQIMKFEENSHLKPTLHHTRLAKEHVKGTTRRRWEIHLGARTSSSLVMWYAMMAFTVLIAVMTVWAAFTAESRHTNAANTQQPAAQEPCKGKRGRDSTQPGSACFKRGSLTVDHAASSNRTSSRASGRAQMSSSLPSARLTSYFDAPYAG